ncbi:MAG: cell division protein FtsA [Candidatus Parcubacteria bacterium]|nr:MAG: cell division protein FtsA [Candidatus Parcubacteria bacterium]
MRKKFFSLDIGNKLIKFCVAEEDENGKVNLLTKLARPIESFNDGEIIDADNFLNEVIVPLKEVAFQIGEDPKDLILSFSSSYFNSQRAKGKISISEKYVSEEDIKKCFLIAKASLISSNSEILFEEPIAYFFENGFKVRDPLGMEARSLEVDLVVIQGLKPSLNKIKDFFNAHGFKVSLVLPNPLPASSIVLPKKDKELGVILIDFGYKIFNLAIFQESRLSFFQNIKFGLGDILEDLAIDLGVDLQEIDSIFEQLREEKIEKKKAKIKIGRQKYTYTTLFNLIEKRFSFYWKKNNLVDLFKKIKENFRLPAGIYLIGGGAYMPEIENILKKNTHYSVKMGNDYQNILSQDEKIYLNSLGAISFYQKLSGNKNFWSELKDIFFRIFK